MSEDIYCSKQQFKRGKTNTSGFTITSTFPHCALPAHTVPSFEVPFLFRGPDIATD